jgi:hypothetical protein
VIHTCRGPWGNPYDYLTGLQKHAGFVDFLALATGVGTNRSVEVETPQGDTLRLELKTVATTETPTNQG